MMGLAHPGGGRLPVGGYGSQPLGVEDSAWGSIFSPSPMRFQKTPPVESVSPPGGKGSPVRGEFEHGLEWVLECGTCNVNEFEM